MERRNGSTSRSPTAMARAAPVERSGRLPTATGHGSRCRSPMRSDRDMSQAFTACKKRLLGAIVRPGAAPDSAVEIITRKTKRKKKQRKPLKPRYRFRTRLIPFFKVRKYISISSSKYFSQFKFKSKCLIWLTIQFYSTSISCLSSDSNHSMIILK